MSDNKEQPLAYMRKWAFDGEKPYKVKNGNGRMVWAGIFRFKDVTTRKVFIDDVPLYAAAQPVVLSDERIHEIAEECGMYQQHDNAAPSMSTVEYFARSILAAKEQA